jgi:general secretion pathway protein C
MAFDRILRRTVRALPLMLVGTAAFLDARAVSHLVGAVLSPPPAPLALPPLARQHDPARAADRTPHETSARALCARNPFDSQSGPLGAEPLASTDALDAPADLVDPMTAPACEGVKVLIIAKAEDPDWSFAAFSATVDGTDTTVLRRRNGDVGDKKLELVGQDRVWLRTRKTRCQAKLFDHLAGVTPVARPATASALDPIIARGIRKTGPNELDIDRAALDKILEDQAELMRTTRAVPEQDKGRTVGLRLSGIEEGSVLAVLGLANGDRLERINGFDVASPEKALEAYARLRDSDQLLVEVNRRGVDQTLAYRIR